MKQFGRKLESVSKRLGGKLTEVGKTFGRKMNYPHRHNHGHYLDDHSKSDLERNHSNSSHYEHRHETRPMGHSIHRHPPLTGAPFMTHGADHRDSHNRKRNH